MKISHILSAVGFALVLAGPACNAKFVNIGDEDAGAGGGCIYNGVTHEVGTSFKSTDGCNTCSCDADGQVACTLMACQAGGASSVGGASGVTCSYNGVNYAVGASFKSADGCNSCGCSATGVACTEMACAAGGASGVGGSTGQTCTYSGTTYTVGASFKSPDGCNGCSCTPYGVACTAMVCGAGGATGVGGSSGETCSYNGYSFPTGSVFKAADGCNSCSCTSGTIACTKMACGVGGSTGAGGSSGVTCAAVPMVMPNCGSVKPIMTYDVYGCPKGYECPVCPAPKADVPTCSPGTTVTATYDANGCVSGYVCPNCAATNIAMPNCGTNIKAVPTVDASGCIIGYSCPICPAIDLALPSCNGNQPFAMYDTNGCVSGYKCPGCITLDISAPSCGSTKAVPVYSVDGCATSYVCPGCPTSTQPSLPCAKFATVTDASTGCASYYVCEPTG